MSTVLKMQNQSVHSRAKRSLEKLESTHPLSLIINLLLVAGAAFFIYLLVTLLAIKGDLSVTLSPYTVAGTFILLIPAYVVFAFKYAFEQEKKKMLLTALIVSVFSFGLFLFFQYKSWTPVLYTFSESVDISQKIFSLLLISHGTLAFVLMLKLGFLAGHYSRTLSDPVLALVVYTNPFEKLRLVLIARVLVFVQLSWALIVGLIYFLV